MPHPALRSAVGPASTSGPTAAPAGRRAAGLAGVGIAARPAPRPRPTTTTTTTTRLPRPPRSTWRDYLPRIVDSIPRRVPAPGGSPVSSSSSVPFTLPSATDAADAARRLFFPESLADPATLTIPVLIFGALAIGVGVEVATIALRALPASPPSGEDGAAVGGGVAGASLASVDGEEDEDAGMSAEAAAAAAAAARDRVMGERYRGLAWLAGAAGLALFSAGLLTGTDKPLQP